MHELMIPAPQSVGNKLYRCDIRGATFQKSTSLGGHKLHHSTGDLWTAVEIEKLKRLHKKTPNSEIASISRRSKNAIECKALRMGLKKDPACNHYNTIFPKLGSSPELAYIVGVILGDGCAWSSKKYHYRYRYLVELRVKDLKFVEAFADALKKIGLNPNYRQDRHGYWHLQAQSKKFVEWFKGLVFEGIENLASLYPADFIRGFYDSEGCLTIRKSHKRLSTGNTKREKLKLVGKALQKLGFNYSIDRWRNKLV